jgi:hypothetical protein
MKFWLNILAFEQTERKQSSIQIYNNLICSCYDIPQSTIYYPALFDGYTLQFTEAQQFIT